MAKLKAIEELKKEYEAKFEALKKEKEEAFKRAKALETKREAAERALIRKQENHVKMILGGYLFSEIRKNKDKAVLDKIKATIPSEKDKKLIAALASSV